MFNRIVIVVLLIPLAVVLIALAVANRTSTAFTLDPFNPGNPALTFSIPLFVLLIAALVAGAILGSLTTWFKQGRYRKMARQRGVEAEAARASAAAAQKAAKANQAAPALPSPR